MRTGFSVDTPEDPVPETTGDSSLQIMVVNTESSGVSNALQFISVVQIRLYFVQY